MMKNRFLNLITVIIVTTLIRNISCVLYDGVIAGNRTISECITGGRPEVVEYNASTPQYAIHFGYPIETHNVVTEDGYILTMHRIPGRKGASPVFLQHGQPSSSFDWVTLGKNRALGFLLADRGYDVWMGNQRGSTYSSCHQHYVLSDQAYWDFSWHEIGVYDLTAEFTYITNLTKQKLIYVGYSSGTTVFYALGADRPNVARKVKAMFALASVAYSDHLTSPLRFLKYFIRELQLYTELFGLELKGSTLLKTFSDYFCYKTALQRYLCGFMAEAILGLDVSQIDWSVVPLVLGQSAGGNGARTSIKCFIHDLQLIKSGKFRQYDYGTQGNLERYNTPEPPDYNVSNIPVPIGIYWSENDSLVNYIDLKRFFDQLPKKIFLRKVKYKYFNHVDYILANNVTDFLYNDLLSEMEVYR